MTKIRRILGVDPGLRVTGYGMIECTGRTYRLLEGGVIEPVPSGPLAQRLAQLYAAIVEVVESTRPDCMVLEELWTSYKNPTTAVLMGHARGVIALAAGVHGVRLEPLAHSSVKRALAGSGSARKAQVGAMVAHVLGLAAPPQPEDITDALALAIAFANVDAQQNRLASAGVVLPRRRSRPTRTST